MNIAQEIKESFKSGTTLIKLIYINIAIFLLLMIIDILAVLFTGQSHGRGYIVEYLTVPAYLPHLLYRPWSLITYMFAHIDFLHILFNMLWLYWFGIIFLQFLNQYQLLSIYLIGGIAGALLYIVTFNVFPVFQPSAANSYPMLGASAGVTAVVFGISIYAPKYKMHLVFIGPVQIIYIAIVAFVVTSIMDFQENTGGKIAHIGGAVTGYLFAARLQKGKDITKGFSRLLDSFFSLFRKRKKIKIKYSAPRNEREKDMEYNAHKVAEQEEINSILDKIAKSGYDSLTKKEKETLFKASRK
ncbi:MAG: rhomboid family intramembrane serine protease [Bacteroidia bacterium]|nr:rhomboid family intramembrane serine protease [Bacteroidia bacterium]